MTTTEYLVDVTKGHFNNAIFQAMGALKSELARTNGALATAMSSALGGNCVYIENFLCALDDTAIFDRLKAELTAHAEATGGDGMVSWSRHMKHEDPAFSATFQAVAATIAAYFDVEMFASRLNLYPDGTHWKCFHKDSHAYAGPNRAVKEDFTIGMSLGATRALTFLHEESETKFSFPQKNGDLFAFSSEVNDSFMHGVPKASPSVGERFSVIVWGKRRTLNARNSGAMGDGGRGALPAEADALVQRISRAMVANTSSGPIFKENTAAAAAPTPAGPKGDGTKKPRNRLQ